MTPKQFKKLRLSLGLTQKQMAAAVGVTSGTIIRYENGHSPIGEQTQLLCRWIDSYGVL